MIFLFNKGKAESFLFGNKEIKQKITCVNGINFIRNLHLQILMSFQIMRTERNDLLCSMKLFWHFFQILIHFILSKYFFCQSGVMFRLSITLCLINENGICILDIFICVIINYFSIIGFHLSRGMKIQN